MVLSEVIPFVQTQLRILELLAMSPFAFNNKSKRFEKVARPNWKDRYFFNFKMFLMFAYVSFTTLNGLYHHNFCSEEKERRLGLENPTYKMFILFFTMVFPTVCVTCSPLWILTDQIVATLNFSLEMEKGQSGEASGRRVLTVKVILSSFTQLSITGPLSVSIFNAFQPSLIPFLGSVLPDINLGPEHGILEKGLNLTLQAVVVVFQLWFYTSAATSSFLIIGHTFLLLLFSVHTSLRFMMRLVWSLFWSSLV